MKGIFFYTMIRWMSATSISFEDDVFFNKIQKKLLHRRLKSIANNKFKLDALLNKIRPRLCQEYFEYPSIINNGYLHIEQTVALADYLQLLSRPGIIIDAGAANGYISRLFASSFPNSDVYCFEPIQTTFDELLCNVKDCQRIHPSHRGLGAVNQTLVINKAVRITSSSLYGIQSNIKDSYLAENIKKMDEEEVQISTLDSLALKDGPIHVFKLDVQGYELEVLKGGAKALERTSIVLLEMQNHSIYQGAPLYFTLDQYLREKNFTLYNIVPSIRKNMKLYEWDAIYLNNESSQKLND